MKNKILLFLCLIPFLGMLSAGLALKELSRPLDLAESTKVEVGFGDSVYKVANKLHEQGVLDYPKLWVWYARIFDMAEKIKVGEYAIDRSQSALQILDDIVKGKVIHYKVTFLEGWTTADAIRALHKSPGIVKTLESNDHDLILRSIGAKQRFQHSEGLLYPETYQYTRGTKDREVMQVAYKRLIKDLDAAWQNKVEGLPYKTPYEVLIMASIIERETAIEAERRQIAGVFVRRLNKGMRLQTDPTVIYGMGERYQGKIRKSDLLKPTVYNTYTIKGLPPTPIALPTKASLQAAVNPLDNGMIYFVAKGDGHHKFSKTLQSHNQAVKDYQLNRSKNYRSSPGQ